MLGEKHDLIHELPDFKDRIHHLKMHDAHFARLFDEYHALDHAIKRVEEGIETPSDDYAESLKKQRLQLKDSLFSMLYADQQDHPEARK